MQNQAVEQHELGRLAREATRFYELAAEVTVELINVSENSMYKIVDPSTGRHAALRVHRLGYNTAEEIESELRWIDALREAGIDTPRALSCADGRRVVSVATDELAEPRNVVLFDWIEGCAPSADDVASFRRLGAISARMHQHSRTWPLPAGFARFVWNYDTMLGAHPRWGRWQDGLGMGAEELEVLGRVDGLLHDRLGAYGEEPDRFGLTHADLRLANLMLEGDRAIVIDFDDSGFSWFMYDWATAVSFIEDHPKVPELQAAWVDGYRSEAPLSDADESELPSFVMLRRLLLTAWVGSHHEFAPEAAELGAAFTAGTCELAEDFLSKGS
jgi:Ser/Thr protein kinase RdoA (MazF antagonist)